MNFGAYFRDWSRVFAPKTGQKSDLQAYAQDSGLGPEMLRFLDSESNDLLREPVQGIIEAISVSIAYGRNQHETRIHGSGCSAE